MESESHEADIAVVGMSCRFPGADGPAAFWANLRAGVESISFYSDEELRAAGYSESTLRNPSFVPAHGAMADPCAFDAGFFGITHREAQVIDPQHRVFLECAWSALEDAGCDPARFPGAIGMYAGCGFSTYMATVMSDPEVTAAVPYRLVIQGNDKDFLTTRTSYKLGLRGPSVSVQTACSTSLVAIHVACQSLLNRECDLALAGGATLGPYQVSGYLYDEGGINSPDGHCRAFDARAAGTVGGSGAGVVVLKRVADALRDGDTIHAVVKGSAINNDGAGKMGFTAPSVEGQAAVVAEALALAGLEPSDVSYVEAHGTGTPLGDPVEASALKEVFRGVPEGAVALGAVKTNIGHLDTAAGVAGFIKTVLALEHGEMPPTLHFQSPHPEAGLEGSPFFVNASLRAWTRNGAPRRAGVSSLGIGGTNAHVVLEEAPAVPPSVETDAPQLLLLSAKSEAALERMRGNLAAHLELHPALPLADVAFTLQEGRAAHRHRWAAAAGGGAEARAALAAPRKPAGRRAADPAPPVAFLFPGQGTQYAGMARALYAREPVFRGEIDRCAGILAPLLETDLRALLFPSAAGGDEADALLRETRYTQPALFAVEYALATLWMSWGVKPAAMLGHSIGEYVAAALAGVFTPEAALQLVAARGRLMQALPAGAMLAVPLPEAEVAPLLGGRLSLAAVNSGQHCVVSGSPADVDGVEALLEERGVAARRLHTSHAFHSADMDPILDAFADEVRRARPAAPALPFVSNVTGDWITPAEATDPGYWVRHLRHTVRFADGVGRLLQDPALVLLEVGPGETLGTFARRHAGADAGRVVVRSLDKAGQPGPADVALLNAAGALWAAGAALDWRAVRGPRPGRRVPLPTYPFERTVAVVLPRARAAAVAAAAAAAAAAAVAPKAETPAAPSETSAAATAGTPAAPAAGAPAASASESPAISQPMAPPVTTASVPVPDKASRIAAVLTDIVAQLVGTEPGQLDPDSSFLEFGVDSLLLMQLSRNVERRFGVRVPFRRLLEGLASIGELSAHLAREVPDEAFPPPAPEPAPAPASAPAVADAAPAAAPAANGASAPVSAPVPVPVNRLPAMRPAGAGDGAALQDIVAQQLALMQTQLALLAGAPLAEASASAAPASAAPMEAPRPAPNGTAGSGTEAAGGTVVSGAPPQAPQTSGAPLPAARVPDAPAAEGDAPAAHGPHRPVRQTMNQHGGFTEQQVQHFLSLVRSYTARTRSSKEYAARNRPVLSDNRASLNFRLATKELMYPIVGDRSQGSRMWDIDGNEYIDFTIGFGVHFFGHRPPFVIQAVEAQLARGYHTGPQSDLAGPVAALFSKITGMERATFCNTGSEAVMTSLRIARTVTGRDKIVLFEGSYHGCFDGIMARKGAGSAGADSRPASPGTPQGMVDDVVVLRYGTPEALEWIRAHAGELAAVLVEPVRTADPEFQPREFLHEVRGITAAAGTVLIFDEMITGLRLQLHGAQGWLGVEADMATYGKVIGGGFPLGVVAGKAYLMDAIDGGQWSFGDDSYPEADQTFFAGTFCKHPVTMAAAHAILLHLQERGQALYDDLHARADRLVGGLRAVLKEEGVPLRIMHSASFFRFVPRQEDQYLDLLFYHMLERGIYVWEGRACFLSTAHTDEDCDRMVQALRESIAALREGGFLPAKPGPGGGGGASAPSRETAGAAVGGAPAPKAFAAPDAPAGARSYPLTAPQRAVWAHAQFGDDASRAYNQEFVVGVRGHLDLDALRAALGDLVAHHEGLRAVFDPAGGALHVLAALRGPIPLYLGDAEAAADPGVEGVSRMLREAAYGVFDLAEGPLFRVHLHARGPDRQVLQFIVHHIAADGQAIDLLKRDLDIAYRARAQGRVPRLPEAMQLGEYATRVAEHTTGAGGAEAEWLARFGGMRRLVLPTDHPRPTVSTHRAHTAHFRLEAPLANALRERSRKLGVTLFTSLLTGVLAALHRMAGQDDLVIGISAAGRPLAGMESVVAHCVDALPIRSRLDGPRRMPEFLKEVRGWLLDAFEDEFFSYARLYEKLDVRKGPGQPPLISVVFNLEPGGGSKPAEGGPAPRFAGLELEGAGAPAAFTKLDIEIDTVDTGEEIDFLCLYSTDLFEHQSVLRVLGNVARMLESIASGGEPLLAEVPLLGEEAPAVSIAAAPAVTPAAGGAEGGCVHELFAAQAARTPDAEALRHEGRSTTYRALDEAANRIAHYLRDRGVGPETRVGVFADRRPETVAAILGVLKAGGAYVPLDPAYPVERLRYMLADAGARTVIAPGELPDFAAGLVPGLLELRAEAAAIAARPATAPSVTVDADGLAYVIYTSGSTGAAKGVMVSHRGVPNLARAQAAGFGIQAGSRVLAFASFSFDAAVSELFTALLAGATLVLATRDELLPGPGLLATLRNERVSVVTLPPTALAALEPDGLPELRTVVSAGEAVSAEAVARWSAGRTFINAYGPTETTVCATMAVCRADGRTPPIGAALENVRVHVLDEAAATVFGGRAGELFVGGPGVARGYLHRPGQTAERFVPDPFGASGGRLYRTGDLVRRRDDGALEFTGRADEQVKIRGYRIEPGEVEAVLRREPGVADCVVVAREDVPGDRRLVAYVVPAADAGAGLPAALREAARERLPEYMVPSAVVVLDRLPLSPNGKVDRKALPAPEYEADEARYVAPRNRVEETLARIWAEVLYLDRVGVDESFFELGGDSILCIQVVSRARREGLEITPPQIFEYPTIAELASVVGSSEEDGAQAADAPRVEGAVPLTPIQAWFLEQDQPAPAHYNQSVLVEVDPSVGDAALESALAAVLDQHDALRLRFRRTEGGWEQWHADAAGITLERVYLSGLAAAEQDRLQSEAADARQASLDLERGPLGRAVLFERGQGRRRLLLILHHLVVDTVSWTILRDDLERAVSQAEAGRPVELGARTTPFRDWARALESYASSDALRAEVPHWLAQGAEGVAPLPADGGGQATVAGSRTVAVQLDADETRALLQDVPAAYRTQINDALLCALAESVSGWAGGTRIRLSLEGHGREGEIVPGVDLTRTVGWFTSAYPVVLDLAGAAGPGDRLKRVKEQLRALPRRGIGYGVLRHMGDGDVRAALQAQPEPEISFNYLGQSSAGGAVQASPLRPAEGPRGQEWAPTTAVHTLLAVNGGVYDGVLRLWWTYTEGTHRRETVEALAASYIAALRGLVAHCGEAGAGGYTPSDFPLAGLTQAELDAAVDGRTDVEDLYPLSPMQQGMLFHGLYGDDTQEYQTQEAQKLEGALDLDLFRRAWGEVVSRHPALRSSFVWDGVPRPLQRVHRTAELPWTVEDWRHLSAQEQDEALRRYGLEDRARGFELGTAPLLRFALFRVSDTATWFVWSQHHLITDGWSCVRLADEAFRLYQAWRTGTAVQLRRSRPYRDYIAWLERQDLDAAERYWRGALAGFTAPTPLPVDRPGSGSGIRHARQFATLPAQLSRALEEAARQKGVTLNTVLQAAWGLLLSRYSGEDDVAFGTTVSGRQGPLEGVEEMIGMFINTLPVRMRVPANARLGAWLGELQRAAGEARGYEYSPLMQVQGWSQVPRGTPLFQSHFIMENYPVEATAAPAASALAASALAAQAADAAVAKSAGVPLRVTGRQGVEWNTFPLSLLAAPGRELFFILSYDENRFGLPTIERILSHLRRVLEQVAAGGDPRLAELVLMDEDERNRVVAEWNDTAAPYPADACVHQLFEAQSARTPDAPAVTFGGAALSYRALDERANQLANYLAGLGVGPEVRVGLCLERGLEVMAAILGVMKAGGAYVPVDPSHPAERIAYVMGDSAVGIVITQTRLADRLPAPDGIRVIRIDAEAEAIAAESADRAESGVTSENLAYVIYTSGSTGRPKGVAMHHRGVSNYIDWGIRFYGADAGSGAPVFSSMAVDLTITNLLPLFCGHPVHLLPEENAVEALADAIRQKPGYGLIKITPTHLTLLNDLLAPEDLRGSTETLVVGADFLNAEPTVFWQEHAPGVRLMNEYGPTETVVGCSAYVLPNGEHRAGPVPVGGAIQNLTFFVLDARMEPVPVGLPGELYIGGAGVARGYLGRPALSAEKFVPDPFAGEGARMYRTGDRARWLPGGNLMILGRTDNQVKIRGYRVELGEVEAALRSHPGVSAALAVMREDVPGDRRLVAYVVGAADADALREHLRATVPEYMVPGAFVRLDSLPQTATGKLDPRTLPAPEYGSAEERYVAPRTEVEQILAGIWAEVLRAERVGVEESFFELGGDSILSIQVVSRARRAGVQISPRQLFEHPTIARLAAVAGGAAPAVNAEQGRVEGTVRLTPVQAAFLSLENDAPGHENQSVLLEVDASLDDAILQEALEAVVEHHDALRLRFRRTADGWEQRHADAAGITLERVDLSKSKTKEQDRAQEEAAATRQASLDLEQGPLGRAVLFDRGKRGRSLLLVIHHLVVDTVSWSVLREDLERACEQLESGRRVELGAKSTSFRQWVQALEAYAAGDALRGELSHWLAQGDEGVARLPVDGEGEETVGGSRAVAVQLDEDETRALLQEVPAAYHTQINDALLAALAQAVTGWAGGTRIRLSLEAHGREEEVAPGVDLTRTVGWFTSMYPVVLDLAGADGAGERLKRVKEQLRAVPLRGIGYGVLRWLSPDAEVRAVLSAPAEPEISFNYLGQSEGGAARAARLRVSGGRRGPESAAGNHRPHLLDVSGMVSGGRLRMSFGYAEGTHRRETVEALAEAYVEALRELVAHCREAGAGGYTPSDFPLAGLSQAELDGAVAGRGDVEDLYPLSPMQQGMLFHAVDAGEAQAYQVHVAQRLEGALDVDAFRRAWAGVVARHPALRTGFVWQALRRPLQRVERGAELPWTVEDWRDMDADEQEAALARFMDDARARGFDLGEPPLLRFALLRVADDAYWFVRSQHHLSTDGWSGARVADEVFRAYQALAAGTPVQPRPVRPYRDYIAWLERQDMGAAERYWRGALAGFTAPTPLPADRPARPEAGVRKAERSAVLSPELTQRVEAVARETGVTLNTVLQGVWGLLLARYGGEDDVVFGTTVSGRPAELDGVEEMIGLFINTLPVRMRVPGGARLAGWLGELQRAQAEMREYEYSPLVQVQGWSGVPRGTPLFESHFIFENYPLEAVADATGGAAGGAPQTSAARLRVADRRGTEWNTYPLSLLALPGARLHFILSYDEHRFNAETVDRMLVHLRRVLEQVAAGPDRRLADLELIGEDERRQVTAEWNDTAAPYPADACIHQLFEAQAARTPDAPAVTFGGAALSYRALDERANQLANYLAGLGVGPEVRVGLCLERGLEVMVAILGVMKAGGAYVPVDPSHPAERIGYVMDDSGVGVVVTQERLRERLPVADGLRVLTVEGAWEAITAASTEPVASGVTSENLAYVIYTSGSTGRPKGVAMHHRGVSNYIDWGIRFYGADAGSGAPVFSSMAVDLTITNLLPLFCGHTVHLLPEENAVEALADAIRQKPGYGLIKITPTHLTLLNDLLTPEDLRGSTKTLVVGADFLNAEPTVFWQDHAPGVRLMNEYGPTETVVGCSAYVLPNGMHRAGPVPVGGAIQNLTFFVLDARMEPVPVGLPGELYIGGAGVARGYLGRPALSAEKFVPDPFAGRGARIYRTGDRARWLPGGNLMILGRTDNQVKIRGYRVELGEVEAALRSHPGVSAALAVMREDAPGDRRLVAYVVGAADADALREHLRATVPEHMVPGAFVRLDSLPQTATGKLDPRTLPAPEYGSAEERYVAPRTEVEEILAGIWAEVLNAERVGAEADFFAMGGHSLLVMRLVSAVQEAFGVGLSMRAVFGAPTLETMAAEIERRIYEDVLAMSDTEAEELAQLNPTYGA